jgi:hypothetical protein
VLPDAIDFRLELARRATPDRLGRAGKKVKRSLSLRAPKLKFVTVFPVTKARIHNSPASLLEQTGCKPGQGNGAIDPEPTSAIGANGSVVSAI